MSIGRPFTEKPMPALEVRYTDDPRRCHCGGWLLAGTDGNGRVVQWCNACHVESSICRVLPDAIIEAVASPHAHPCATVGCGGVVNSAAAMYCTFCTTDRGRALRRQQPHPCGNGCGAVVLGRRRCCPDCTEHARKANARARMERCRSRARAAGRAA